MVAYSFHKMFAQPILDGSKPHTLRGPRRRHARPGEEIQLYTGMRTRHCRLIARVSCDRFCGIYLKFSEYQAFYVFDVVEQEPGSWRRRGELEPISDPESFARSDGFANLEAMARFWWDVHGLRSWEGFLVGWLPIGALGRAAA